jgi:hypothetical protein
MKTTWQKYLSMVSGLFVLSTIYSCGKPFMGENLNSDFRKYYDYKVGSYWAFYDSLNNIPDTLYVFGNMDQPPSSSSSEQVIISMNDYDSLGSNGWSLYLTGPSVAGLHFFYGFTQIRYELTDGMPFNVSKILNQDGSLNSVTNLLPQCIIANQSYNNVYQISYFYIPISPSTTIRLADTIYVNSDSGFIAVLLHNQYSNKRLFLNSCKLIR